MGKKSNFDCTLYENNSDKNKKKSFRLIGLLLVTYILVMGITVHLFKQHQNNVSLIPFPATLSESIVDAQISPSGQGIFLVSNCNIISNPVNNGTVCFTPTSISIYSSGSYQSYAGTGNIASVGGTSPIVSSGGNNPVISIGAPYGATTYTAHGVLIGEGTSNIASTVAGALDTFLQGQGNSADPAFAALVSCSAATDALIYNTTTHVFGCTTFGTVVTYAVGTSGGTVPLLNGTNTWAGTNTFSVPIIAPSGILPGIQNPSAIGATDSTVSASCTATASNPVLASCTGGADLVNGGNVAVLGGTAVNSIGPPTGDLTVTSLTQPGGSTGSTTDRYCVTSVDANLGESACSSMFQTTTAASVLGGNQWNNVTFDKVTGAIGYKVYFCTGAACSSPTMHGYVKTAADSTGCPSGGHCIGYPDMGETNPAGTAPPVSATTGTLLTTISSGAGTGSIALATPPTASGTVTVVHDNYTPIQTAMNALTAGSPNASTPAGGSVYLGRGDYCLPYPLIIPNNVQLWGAPGTNEYTGSSITPNSAYGTTLTDCMQTDGIPMVTAFDVNQPALTNFSLDARCFNGDRTSQTACTGATATGSAIGVYLDADSSPEGTDKFSLVNIGVSGAHIAYLIGSTLGGKAYNQQPQSDVSGGYMNTLGVQSSNTTDNAGAQGLEFKAANACFATNLVGLVCTGDLYQCLDMKNCGGWDRFSSVNCGLSGATITNAECINNESGSTGTIMGTIDDSSPRPHVISGESEGNTPSSGTTFSFTVAKPTIVPNATAAFTVAGLAITCTDLGNGNCAGSGFSTSGSTIDYVTGNVTLTFSSALLAAHAVTGTYKSSSTRSYIQPQTTPGAPGQQTVTLLGNQFNNAVVIQDGQNVASIGNTAGGNTPTWIMANTNFNNLTLTSDMDTNQAIGSATQAYCPWAYDGNSSGHIFGQTCNAGTPNSFQTPFSQLGHCVALDPLSTTKSRIFMCANNAFDNDFDLQYESGFNTGIIGSPPFWAANVQGILTAQGRINTLSVASGTISGAIDLYAGTTQNILIEDTTAFVVANPTDTLTGQDWKLTMLAGATPGAITWGSDYLTDNTIPALGHPANGLYVSCLMHNIDTTHITVTCSGDQGGGGGGSSFNPASPGPIGGTTSSTGQFTQLSVGTSVPALPGTVGDVNASGAYQCTTNNTTCLSAENPAGNAQLPLASIDGSSNAIFGATGVAGTSRLVDGTSVSREQVGTAYVQSVVSNQLMLDLEPTFLSLDQGATFQITGGTAPTCTTASGSCALASGSNNNRGQMQLTGGTAVTTLTLTFSAAGTWNQSPFCLFTDANASITPKAYSTGACGTSTCVVDFTSSTATNVNYMCM